MRVVVAVVVLGCLACGGTTEEPRSLAIVEAGVDAEAGASSHDGGPRDAGIPGAVACGKRTDEGVRALEGRPCDVEGATCDSNNGCGGCFVKCAGHRWVANGRGEADAAPPVCYAIGNGC